MGKHVAHGLDTLKEIFDANEKEDADADARVGF